MATLKSGESHSWDKKKYSKLELKWADPKNPGKNTVSVKIGDDAPKSYSVPQAHIVVNQKAGKLTNNTDKTIEYILS